MIPIINFDEDQIGPAVVVVSLAEILVILQTILAFRLEAAATSSFDLKHPKLPSEYFVVVVFAAFIFEFAASVDYNIPA